jgi:hypothetical protein
MYFPDLHIHPQHTARRGRPSGKKCVPSSVSFVIFVQKMMLGANLAILPAQRGYPRRGRF